MKARKGKKDQAPMRATIKEELVVLTGDYVAALLLNQFLRWCSSQGEEGDCQERWVSKDTMELARGLMTRATGTAVGVHLQRLVCSGWLLSRRRSSPPYHLLVEYRPDYDKIAADLQALGYALDVT
jgi:hypothetical protein